MKCNAITVKGTKCSRNAVTANQKYCVQHLSKQHLPSKDELEARYCRCLKKIKPPYNEYAVCTASIYNRRGLKGLGSHINCNTQSK